MEKSLAPTNSPTPPKGGSQSTDYDQLVAAAKQNFIASALSMSWQLAVVVLVPVIGGFKLDEHFNTGPLLTILGFILAGLGMSLVLWHQLQKLSPVPSAGGKK